MGNKYGARKTHCNHGHTHDSKREAKRCDELHLLQRGGEIVGLQVQPPKVDFVINGAPVKLANGHVAGIKPDFSYVEKGQKVIEDSKGMIVRDFPLRWAIAKHLHPSIDWRLV